MVAKLTDLKKTPGPCLQSAYDSIQSGMHRGIKLNDTHTLRISFQKDADSYVERLVTNLQDRFDTASMSVLEEMDNVLNPTRLDITSKGIGVHGLDSLEKLCDHFGETKLQIKP